MAVKQFDLPDIGTVFVYKRAGVRNLRLTIRSDGSVRVTIPAWSAYGTGVDFARSRADWIKQHAGASPSTSLVNGQLIGKAHRLRFTVSTEKTKASSRLRQNEIIITYPAHLGIDDASVQAVATAACLRALRQQAEQLLPFRLRELADKHGFTYRSVNIKNLKSRWGSCDQDTNIILNLYLMQLPWKLIDYVLLHELTHTRIMRHGPPFWAAMEAIEPYTQDRRRAIKAHQTTLQ